MIYILSAEDLKKIGRSTNYPLSGIYELRDSIDFNQIDIEPIGTPQKPFTGIFDGGGFCIKNLKINRIKQSNIGLFSYIGKGSIIRNLNIKNVHVKGSMHIGGLVGTSIGGTITNCSVTGIVNGIKCIGGLVGSNMSTINECHVSVDISGVENIGGLTGKNSLAIIRKSSASGSITGNINIGSIVGLSESSKLEKSFSVMQIYQDSPDFIKSPGAKRISVAMEAALVTA